MLKNYLNTALRYFMRNRFFSFLNIFGLAVGFACSLLLAMFVWQEATYDNFHENRQDIVRVISSFKMGDYEAQTATSGSKVAPAFVSDIPEVQQAVRFYKYPVVVSREEQKFEEERFVWADSSVFDVFSFRLLRGDPATALSRPGSVVITEETARKYFGEHDPIGEVILINNQTEYEVTGIVQEPPVNSQIRFDFLASFNTLRAAREVGWFPANYYTYLHLVPGVSRTGLEDKLNDYMAAQSEETGMSGENYLKYQLENLEDVHLYSSWSGLEPNIDERYVIIFFLVTILVLAIACINYMNLATARAADRGTEVGVRKVMGAHRSQLFWQYITESFLSVLIAAGLAVVLASVMLPFFNTVLNREYALEVFLSPIPLLIIGTVLLIVALGAGMYPSLVLTHFNPVSTLKGSFSTSRAGLGLRRGLIVFQFVVSAALIISSLVIYRQIQYIKTSDLGYQKEFVVALGVDDEVEKSYDVLKSQLADLPGVESTSLIYETPTVIDWRDGMVTPEGKQILLAANPVDQDYLTTFDIRLLAGRDFDERDQQQARAENAGELNEESRNIIINEKAARELGWSPEEAIGRRVEFKGNATIIGVIDNFYFSPVHEEIGPLILFVDQMYNQLAIRLSGTDVAGTLSMVEEAWEKVAPHMPFDPVFLDEEYNAIYENEEKLGMLFAFFTALTIILGVLGLLGLSALMISHRTREIGIRKVLGASVQQIVRVLSVDFIKLVFIAFILAVPLAWYAMDQWLQTFSHRISMPWYLFVLSGVLLLVLALVTLSTQTVRAALRNPTDVIRTE